ncbi:MAG: glutamate racemase, partial [Muribaculaceae bacterium]|nr:glutamate racemase [Muribaculaceae bacterium]
HNIEIVTQGGITAESLVDYLYRHPEMDARCTRGGQHRYFTTEDADKFADMATMFMGRPIEAAKAVIDR